MTPLLILTRAAIIGWTTLAVFPLEMAFDVIEGRTGAARCRAVNEMRAYRLDVVPSPRPDAAQLD
jgi:hypothetical protein